MGLLLAILGGLAAAIFVASRLMGAARDGKEAVDDLKGAVRRGQWSRQIDARLIENIEDPRESAAILLVQMASYDGEITVQQKATITAMMREYFKADGDEAEGLYSFGRMAIGQINDAANSLNKLLRPIKASLTVDEKKDFITMLETTAEVEAEPTERQRDLALQVRRNLLEQ